MVKTSSNQKTLDFSRKQRDKGIKKAADSAEEISPGWNEKAFKYLLAFVKSRKPGQTFKAEDIREDAGTCVPEPKSNRAWGGIMKRAMREGVIKKVGIVSVCNPKAHLANANLYVKNV